MQWRRQTLSICSSTKDVSRYIRSNAMPSLTASSPSSKNDMSTLMESNMSSSTAFLSSGVMRLVL